MSIDTKGSLRQQMASTDDPSCNPMVFNSRDHKNVTFVVTGFGPFGGVETNPTTTLVNELKEFLQQSLSVEDRSLAMKISKCIVLETSAQEVCRVLDDLAVEWRTSPTLSDTTVVLLHLGVNERGAGFQLEQCAYNDATFRIPDQKGYQPQQESIIPLKSGATDYSASTTPTPIGERLDSCFDLNRIVQEQVQEQRFQGMAIAVSTDPGRFVCNYVYCYSLYKFQNHPSHSPLICPDRTFCSLFVHVPPFTVISKSKQLEYLANLMHRLVDQIMTRM